MTMYDRIIDRETEAATERLGMGDTYQTHMAGSEGLLYAGGKRFLIRQTRASLIEKHKAKSRDILKG